ncbi:MAG: P-II family nitrogen regulator [Solirubrobacteraceae bacterium]|nr:P-II family nitrogen regulator [Solirubrobacteraceae bacterium]
MKLITAYVRHEAFEPIRAQLLEKGLPSISIAEVKGSGRQKGVVESYRGAKLTNYLRPMVKIECAVDTAEVDTVVQTILAHGQTGEVGDGKIFISALEQVIRIRTGEFGPETLQAHDG